MFSDKNFGMWMMFWGGVAFGFIGCMYFPQPAIVLGRSLVAIPAGVVGIVAVVTGWLAINGAVEHRACKQRRT